ncbi:hypothetical protein DPSP01_013995 [Paraphaeosphaeria sporulosa]
MAEWRKQALEEVNQIQTFEEQQQQNHVAPHHPSTPQDPASHATAPVVAATSTPHKAGRKLKGFFTRTRKKKKDAAGICRPVGIERPLPSEARTLDPNAVGQMPGEDSWEWYERNILFGEMQGRGRWIGVEEARGLRR